MHSQFMVTGHADAGGRWPGRPHKKHEGPLPATRRATLAFGWGWSSKSSSACTTVSNSLQTARSTLGTALRETLARHGPKTWGLSRDLPGGAVDATRWGKVAGVPDDHRNPSPIRSSDPGPPGIFVGQDFAESC